MEDKQIFNPLLMAGEVRHSVFSLILAMRPGGNLRAETDSVTMFLKSFGYSDSYIQGAIAYARQEYVRQNTR